MSNKKSATVKIKFNQYILLLVFFFLIGIFAIIQGNRMIGGKIESYKQKEEQKVALETRIENLDKLESQTQSCGHTH